MAPLNPNAPLYIPAIQFPRLQHHYSLLPPSTFLPQYHYYVDQNLFHTTFRCYYPPLSHPRSCYYFSPYVVQKFSYAPTLPSLPPCSGFEMQEETSGPLLEEIEDKEVQFQTSNTQAKELKEDEDRGEGGNSDSFDQDVRRCWKLKGSSSKSRKLKGRSQRKPLAFPSMDFEFNEEEAIRGDGTKTTVMMKNLPNKFTKKRVLELLDDHCMKENQKLQPEGDTTFSEFDFLYLPMDFRSGSNLGYAFVNFTSAVAAWRFYRYVHQKSWAILGSRKVCEVTYARIQGLPALLKHFKNSTFICETDEYLPVYFTPNRNGFRLTEQQYIGKHIPKPTA